jgi:DtxR family transcriptional regulator, Mn-dependent transcriptional regulator
VLTPEGKVAAGRVMRRHRLWERFLRDVLGLRTELVHEEACKFEHDTSPEVEQLLSQAVCGSDTCPHGRPIPAAGSAVGTLVAEAPAATVVMPLSDLRSGETAEVAQLPVGRRAAARFLALGFTVGVEVRMLQNAGVGPIIALVRDTRIAIGRGEARQVGVVRRTENGSHST